MWFVKIFSSVIRFLVSCIVFFYVLVFLVLSFGNEIREYALIMGESIKEPYIVVVVYLGLFGSFVLSHLASVWTYNFLDDDKK
jgi:hypothetical protein